MLSDEPTPAAFFENLFREDPDPWRFATSDYERAKYAATLAALPRARYRAALEIGCANGVLTRLLAQRCTALLAVDLAESALALARERCRDLTNVRLERRALPQQFPAQRFDLVLLSEVGYYLSRAQLHELRGAIAAALESGGHLVLVHWTPPIADRLLSGDAVHDIFLAGEARLRHVAQTRAETYRLDVLERV